MELLISQQDDKLRMVFSVVVMFFVFVSIVKYIKSVDGFTGCYRGLVPKLCSYTVSAIAFDKTSESIKFDDEPDKQIDEEELTEQDR